MRGKILLLLGFILAIATPSAFAQLSVTPQAWSKTLTVGSYVCQQFNVTNQYNYTETVDIFAEGVVLTFSTTWLNIPEHQTKSFQACFVAENKGDFLGKIRLKYEGSKYIDIPVSFSVKSQEEIQYLVPVIKQYDKYIKQGEVQGFQVKIKNLGDQPVKLEAVEVGGATPDFFRVEYELPDQLNVGETLTLKVTIDASNVKPQDYTAWITVVGFVDNKRVEARVDINIHVLRGVAVSTTPSEIKISIPDFARPGEQVVFNVSGYTQETSVSLDIEPFDEVSLVSCNIQDGSWIAKYVFNRTGEYTVTVRVYRLGAIAKQETKTLIVSGVTSSKCTLDVDYVLDEENKRLRVKQVLINETGDDVSLFSKIFLDGEQIGLSWASLEPGTHDLDVYYGNCKSWHKTIEIQKPNLNVTITPPNPVKGKPVTIKVQGVSEATITVNNNTYNLTELTITPTEPLLDIRVEADGYAPFSKLIFVKEPVKAIPETVEVTVGKQASLQLTRNAEWEIRKDGAIVAKGNGTEIVFSPNEEGVYYVYAEGDKIATITAKKNYLNMILIGVIVAVLAFLLFGGIRPSLGGSRPLVVKAKKKKKRESSSSEAPPASEEVG